MATKKRGLGLGRGLDVLLGGGEPDAAPNAEDDTLRTLPVSSIVAGKYQPRQVFDPERLEELAASIRAQGVIEPVIVRPSSGGRFELIAGERRWRATQLAGLTEIPALVRVIDDRAVVAVALIENIQREDLSPLEEAQALARLIEEFDLTHQQAAEAVGRSRAAVSNLLRLLDLPEAIRELLERGKLDMGHARALLTLSADRAIDLATQAVANGWSVRELEDAARQSSAPARPDAKKKAAAPRDADIQALERELAEKLCTRVAINHGRNGRGKLVIHYHSVDELDGVLEKLR
ncbi:ParB/RepB/Spo0J family partition protein [Dokdonella sp. MW10]|uniref:ParB/RepB/Spo0J family partition protein n=1 Tax=Dokdonella sp. MW10 TaxID=2992926 RepID=UPI003F81B763